MHTHTHSQWSICSTTVSTVKFTGACKKLHAPSSWLIFSPSCLSSAATVSPLGNYEHMQMGGSNYGVTARIMRQPSWPRPGTLQSHSKNICFTEPPVEWGQHGNEQKQHKEVWLCFSDCQLLPVKISQIRFLEQLQQLILDNNTSFTFSSCSWSYSTSLNAAW